MSLQRQESVLRQQEFISHTLARRRQWKWIIFYHDSVKPLATKVQKEMLSQGGRADLADINWSHFNDGFPDLAVSNLTQLPKYDGTCFVMSLHSPDVIFEQMAVLYALPEHKAKNLRIILPFFSTGKSDRAETRGQVTTAMSLASMISLIPHGVDGPATLAIYDIHALGEQFYFQDRVSVELKSTMCLLRTRLRELRAGGLDEDFAIVFPDEGAYKQFHGKFDDLPQVVCTRRKVDGQSVVAIHEGSPQGKHVVIVDDYVVSGDTITECAKVMRDHGAVNVSCYVAHAVFPQESHKRFLDARQNKLANFWISDTHPLAAEIDGKGPFKALSAAPLMARYLLGQTDDYDDTEN